MILRVRPEARSDILEAARWYEEQQAGMGEALVAEVDAVLHRIERGPLRFRVAYRSLRIALSHRFPYAVYFLPEGDDIVIFGVLHQRRDRRLLGQRIDE